MYSYSLTVSDTISHDASSMKSHPTSLANRSLILYDKRLLFLSLDSIESVESVTPI